MANEPFRPLPLIGLCAPAGFFTGRYRVVDVTESLDVLFHSVDGFYVDAALDMTSRTVVPHVLQTLALLDESSADQRSKVKADDAIGA